MVLSPLNGLTTKKFDFFGGLPNSWKIGIILTDEVQVGTSLLLVPILLLSSDFDIIDFRFFFFQFKTIYDWYNNRKFKYTYTYTFEGTQ